VVKEIIVVNTEQTHVHRGTNLGHTFNCTTPTPKIALFKHIELLTVGILFTDGSIKVQVPQNIFFQQNFPLRLITMNHFFNYNIIKIMLAAYKNTTLMTLNQSVM